MLGHMSTAFNRIDLRAALGAPAAPESHSCPDAGCTAFPFESAADLAAHIASGKHVGSKFGNAFASTGVGVTDRSAHPQFARNAVQARYGRSITQTGVRANKYDASCVKCGAKVLAGAGTLNKVNDKWIVAHVEGECVTVAPKAPVAPAEAPKVRSNRYAAKCADCRKNVAEEAGRLSKTDDGKWEVRHLEGECPQSEFPFPYGKYALTVDGVVKFYDATEDGLYAQGSDDFYLLTSGAKGVVEAIAADPLAASKLYGQSIGKCGRCGRTLTDATSRENGIGPVCANKSWA